ncbi:histidinol-phosphatase, partial [Halorubrum sp. SS5]
HAPDEIAPRVREVEAELDRRGLDSVQLDEIATKRA